jgi:hypothetical protein
LCLLRSFLIESHCSDSSQFDTINFLKDIVEIVGGLLIFKRQVI